MSERSNRVVHVINEIVPGGAEKQVLGIVERSRFDAHVVELQVPQVRSGREMLWRLHGELRRRDPGAVVAWLDRSQIAVAAVATRKRALIASVRGPPQRRPNRVDLAYRGALARFGWHVANSAALRDMTRHFMAPFPLRRFAVIPNGVEEATAAELPPREPGARLRLGYLGRAHRFKGVDVLLEALAGLEPAEASLRLVGRGVPDAVAARPDLHDRVVACERVSKPWDALGAVDVLVVPSRHGSEGSPNVVLEAFARGIPVIGTTDPGAEELLRDGRGTVVPEGDAEALRRAIRAVAADPGGARSRAVAARDYVRTVHSWPRVATAWDDLVGRALERAGR